MAEKKQKRTTIGGQAVIEGIMMRGVNRSAMAVRKTDGGIAVEEWEHKAASTVWYKKTPFFPYRHDGVSIVICLQIRNPSFSIFQDSRLSSNLIVFFPLGRRFLYAPSMR